MVAHAVGANSITYNHATLVLEASHGGAPLSDPSSYNPQTGCREFGSAASPDFYIDLRGPSGTLQLPFGLRLRARRAKSFARHVQYSGQSWLGSFCGDTPRANDSRCSKCSFVFQPDIEWGPGPFELRPRTREATLLADGVLESGGALIAIMRNHALEEKQKPVPGPHLPDHFVPEFLHLGAIDRRGPGVKGAQDVIKAVFNPNGVGKRASVNPKLADFIWFYPFFCAHKGPHFSGVSGKEDDCRCLAQGWIGEKEGA